MHRSLGLPPNNCSGCIHTGYMTHQRHHVWAAVASLPLLGVRDAVRPTFWDLDMFPWTFPSDISPDNHCFK